MKTSTFLVPAIIALALTSCKEDAIPKPDGFLSLEYPTATYETYNEPNGFFKFNKNKGTVVKPDENFSFKIDYPKMKASIYINYRPVNNNLNLLLKDAQKLTYEHIVKADDIQETVFEHPEKNVYGMFYKVIGDAATNVQFYATDSTKNFVVGTLYFYSKPNFDSIYPATKYIEEDMKTLMESLEWTKK